MPNGHTSDLLFSGCRRFDRDTLLVPKNHDLGKGSPAGQTAMWRSAGAIKTDTVEGKDQPARVDIAADKVSLTCKDRGCATIPYFANATLALNGLLRSCQTKTSQALQRLASFKTS